MGKHLRIVSVLALLACISLTAHTQNGKLTIHQSPEVKRVVEKHVKINTEKPLMRGWRIQVYSVSGVGSKEKANEVLEKFSEAYPDAAAYVVYNAPYFRVRIGNFRTQIEALYFLQCIIADYPHGFPVIDYIDYPGFE